MPSLAEQEVQQTVVAESEEQETPLAKVVVQQASTRREREQDHGSHQIGCKPPGGYSLAGVFFNIYAV